MGYPKIKNYNYIYFDEAQDYNDSEIKLICDLEDNPIVNIYGDVNQNIIKSTQTRDNWDNLKSILGMKLEYFKFDENYRNTSDVVEYCNHELSTNMMPIGYNGNSVNVCESMDLDNIISLARKGAIIITNNSNYSTIIKNFGMKCYSVLEAKGLEFSNVIVIDENLSKNEKYIAYTRTKNDLTIVKKVDIEKY